MSTPAAPPPFRSERIPAEIWLQVIEGCSLEQEDIASLSLVGKHLRYVAQPMLFAEIQVTLIKARYLDTYMPVRCQHARYHDRLKKRLEFATSNRIAYFVRSLSIRVAGDRVDVETEDAVKEGQILHEIFQDLHHFVSLRSFSAQDISLDGSHFDLLAQLQHFNGIHLERCMCTGDLGLTRFKLKYLSLHGKMSGSFGWWIPLVTSSSVEHLSYDAPPPMLQGEEPEILFPALSVLPRPLHLLRTLRLPAHAQLFPCFVSALSRCSSVENLYIDPSPSPRFHPLAMASGQIALSHNTLPNLKAVGAPAHFIESLIMSRTGRANFKHVSVWGQNYNAMEMLELIRDRCPELEEIVVDLPSLHTMAPLDLLLLDFPTLRGLYVVTNGHYPPYKQVRPCVSEKKLPLAHTLRADVPLPQSYSIPS